MNLLECIARVGVENKNVPEMLAITDLSSNVMVKEVFEDLLEEFEGEFVSLLCNHTPDEYITEVYGGLAVDVTDVIEDEFFIIDEDTEEIDEEKRDNLNDKLTDLANIEVYCIIFKDGKVYYNI